MELFHLKTPYLDCPQCFFYNSRALSGTLYIGIAKQEPEGAEPLMDVTANLSDEVPLGCIAVKDYSENTGLLAFLKSIGFITEVVEKRRSGYVEIPICRYDKAVLERYSRTAGRQGMGTNTDFTGAIRITPCVEEPLATRLKQFMDIRHMKRNVKTLHTLFPDLEDRKPMSLFGDGDFGEEGAFFIPVETPDLNRRLHEAGPYPEGLDNKFSMNKPPNPCPSLYCDLVLLNDPNNGRSYLGWNEAEKSYYITDWIELIAGWLSERGYHLDGKMFAVVEGGMSYYTITVDGAKVTSTEFTPEATYVSEFNDLLYED